jgi:RNA polymerase sigma-70 factor (ECF subfamily)
LDSSGNLASLFDQDRSQWDQELIGEGLHLLEQSAIGSELSAYRVEAAIAAVHATAARTELTGWATIILLYDVLMTVRPSPIVALNCAIAVAQREGPVRGLEEIQAISNRERLIGYPFYTEALGELELRRGRRDAARAYFRTALARARNPMERRFLDQRARNCDRPVVEGVPA